MDTHAMKQALERRQQQEEQEQAPHELALQKLSSQMGSFGRTHSEWIKGMRRSRNSVTHQGIKSGDSLFISRVKREDLDSCRGRTNAQQVKERIGEIVESMKTRFMGMATNDQSLAFDAVLLTVKFYADIKKQSDNDTHKYQEDESAALKSMMVTLRSFVEQNINGLAKKPVCATLRAQMKCAFELQSFFENRSMGSLTKVDPPFNTLRAIPKDGSITTTGFKVGDKPLFPHEPCIQDIRQGRIGDCYLLSGLGSIVTTNPQMIRDCMRDNGDGTVTVRFYKKINPELGNQSRLEPIHVIVDKELPRLNGSDVYNKGSIWVSMIERAYAASGLHITNKPAQTFQPQNGENPVDTINRKSAVDAFNQKRQAIIDWQRRGMEVLELQKANNTVKLEELMWLPAYSDIMSVFNGITWPGGSYGDIDGGRTNQFLETLLGPAYEGEARTTAPPSLPSAVTKLWSSWQVEQKLQVNTLTTKMNGTSRHPNAQPMGWRERLKKSKPVAPLNADALVGEFVKYTRDKLVAAGQYDTTGGVSSDDDASNSMYSMKTDAGILANTFLREFLEEKRKKEVPFVFQAYETFLTRLITQSKISDIQRGDGVWDEIEENLKAGKLMSVGTRVIKGGKAGLNGERGDNGIYGEHAYTLLGTETRRVKNKDYRFVKLRNPWGEKGRDYYIEDSDPQTLCSQEIVSGSEGVFLVEFDDFLRYYNIIFLN